MRRSARGEHSTIVPEPGASHWPRLASRSSERVSYLRSQAFAFHKHLIHQEGMRVEEIQASVERWPANCFAFKSKDILMKFSSKCWQGGGVGEFCRWLLAWGMNACET